MLSNCTQHADTFSISSLISGLGTVRLFIKKGGIKIAKGFGAVALLIPKSFYGS
jgi:hypothetical protein